MTKTLSDVEFFTILKVDSFNLLVYNIRLRSRIIPWIVDFLI